MKNDTKSRHLFQSVRGDGGIALLQIVFVLVLVAVAIGAAVLFSGVRSKYSKVTDARGGVDGAVQAVISFAEANRLLPTWAQFPTLLKSPNDSWGQPFYYVYDNNLTNLNTGGVCGRSTTDLTIRSRRCQDAGCTVFVDTTYQNVAFMVLSAGPNFHNQTRMSGGIIGAVQADIYDVDARAVITVVDSSGVTDLIYDDIVRVVSLNELQQQAGCFGTTRGRLQILNNELPKVCSGATTYNATLYGDGGVPAYTWSQISGPAWLTVVAGTGVLSPVGSITSTPGIYQFTFGVTDSQTPAANSAQKTLKLEVISCGPNAPPGSEVSFTNPTQFQKFVLTQSNPTTKPGVIKDNSNNTLIIGSYSQGSEYACVWYPDRFPFAGKIARAYYEFQFWLDPDKDYGDGFTFTLMTDSNGVGSCGEYQNGGMGYNTLPGASIAAEFDTAYQNTKNDPASGGAADGYNHVAIVSNGNNRHATGNNQTCNNTQPGCKDGRPSEQWFEDGVSHKIRIDVDGTAKPLGGSGPVTMKVWYNCTDAACRDLTQTPGTLPTVTQTITFGASMDWVLFGFTESTSGQRQYIRLSDFGIAFVTPTNVPPRCVLWTNPYIVNSGNTTQLSYTIADGPANGTFFSSPAGKTGTCPAFVGSTGGSCTSGNLTQNTTFTLNVTNAFPGSGTCTGKSCVPLYSAYNVYNNTGNKWDFKLADGTTCTAVANGAFIGTVGPGQTLIKYNSNNSHCENAQLDSFTYENAVCTDGTIINGNVNWDMTDR
jgi:hypothetical protein